MSFQLQGSELDAILPGVTVAYKALRLQDGLGVHTSNGRFYNHTFFGRDASMAAKFVSDFDHEMVRETIIALAKLQGTKFDTVTQEQPGRIHHEFRDFRTWKSPLFDRIPFWLMRGRWAIQDHRLISYFALDTSASFIRLVHKYATRIDRSILDSPVIGRHGETRTVEQAVLAAAEWIVDKIDEDGLIGEQRHNPWSLPFQTFQDSFYARHDGSLVNYRKFITYVEVQAFAADALFDMVHLFPSHENARVWRQTALRMQWTMLGEFSDESGFLASAIDSHGPVDVPNISAGWTLNTLLWEDTPLEKRAHHIGAIVEQLFSDEFLTPVGLRTRAKSAPDPIHGAVDYHGSETVWPMFNFMVVEGLRRHRLYQLAEQLEHRIINGLNAAGEFPEYLIVQRSGEIILPKHSWWGRRLDVSMKQESNIAFSVVPAMVLARRTFDPPEMLQQLPWQAGLDRRVTALVPQVDRAKPSDALSVVGPVQYRTMRRWIAGLKTINYFRRQQP